MADPGELARPFDAGRPWSADDEALARTLVKERPMAYDGTLRRALATLDAARADPGELARLRELERLYDPAATERVAPNVPGCSCESDPDDDEAGEPVLCPMHEARLRKLRWSTLALMVIDYEALIHATDAALRQHTEEKE